MKGDFLGFSFDGIHCSQLGITHVSSSDRYDEDLFPEVKDKTIEIPNNHGEYYYGSTYGTRTFEIEIAYDSVTETQFRNIRRLFGTRRVCELIFDERPYKVYYAKIESPIEMSYVCFDEQKRHIGDTISQGGIRYVEKDGELVKEDITPWVYEFDSKGQPLKQRIYKGEGTVNLICYQPFAHQLFKIKELYERAGENEGNLVTRYTNVDEWIESSGILTEQEWNEHHIDQVISAGAPYTYRIPVYNPGDLNVGFCLYIPFSSVAHETGTDEDVVIPPGELVYTIKKDPVGEITVTGTANYTIEDKTITFTNDTEFEIEATISYAYNTYTQEILPKDGNSDIIINGDTEILVLKPIQQKSEADTGILINTRTHLIEGVSFSQIANENDYRRPAWQTTGTLYNEFIKMGEFPYIKRNDWRLDTVSNRPQAIYISCAEVEGIRIHYDYLYF